MCFIFLLFFVFVIKPAVQLEELEYSYDQLCFLLDIPIGSNPKTILEKACCNLQYGPKLINKLLFIHDKRSSIKSACKYLDCESVKKLLFNYPCTDEFSLNLADTLNYAYENVLHGKEIIQVLQYRFGCKPDDSCLSIACQYQDLQTVKNFPNYEALKNNIGGLCLLSFACMNKNLRNGFEIANWLLCDKHFQYRLLKRDFNDYVPLHYACLYGNLDLVRLFYSYMNGMHLSDSEFLTLSCQNIEHGSEIIKYLIESANLAKLINVYEEKVGSSCFDLACKMQDINLIKFLASNGGWVSNNSLIAAASSQKKGYEKLKYLIYDMDSSLDDTQFLEIALNNFSMRNLSLLLNFIEDFQILNTMFKQVCKKKFKINFFGKLSLDRLSYTLTEFLVLNKLIYLGVKIKFDPQAYMQKLIQNNSMRYIKFFKYQEFPRECLNFLYKKYLKLALYKKCLEYSSKPTYFPKLKNFIFDGLSKSVILRESFEEHLKSFKVQWLIRTNTELWQEMVLEKILLLNNLLLKLRSISFNDAEVDEIIKEILSDPYYVPILRYFKLVEF